MSLAILSFDSGEASLSVRSFRVDDVISRPFTVAVQALSPNQIDLETLIGRGAAFSLDDGTVSGRGDTRRWSGVCQHIEQVQAEPTGLSTYEVRIKPNLWLLTQRRGYHVYQ